MTTQHTSPAMRALENAANAKRQEWYGEGWQQLDWYGIPKRDLPQEQREAILKEQRRKRNAINAWLVSPAVTKFCDESRKEREARFEKKQCACGNVCTEEQLFNDEYICGECR